MSEALTEKAQDGDTAVSTTTVATMVISAQVSTPNYYELGLEHKAANNLSGALHAFKREISKNPKNAQAWLEMGRTHALLGDYSNASANLLHVTHLEPMNHKAYYFLGCIYNLLGRYKEAAEALRKATIEKASGAASSNSYYKLGYACQMDGQYREAIKSYSRYLSSVSSEEAYSALVNRGMCYYSVNGYNKALIDFERAISMSNSENKPYLLCCRGRTKAKLGDRDGAIEDFNEARTYSSSSLSYEAGVTDNELHENRNAITNYTRAIDQNKHTADSYFRRGLSHAILGEYDNAVADYTKAIEESPGNNHPRAYFRRGISYVALKRLDDALRDYTTAINLAQYYQDVYLMRAQLYLQLGRAEEATEDFRKAAFWKQEESFEDDINNNTGIEELAIPVEPPLVNIPPDSPVGILNNGLEMEKAGNNRGAFSSYNRLFDFDPELLKNQLDELAKRKNPSTFNITQAENVKTTLQKHNDAMKKFGNNMNLKIFYASILFQLEELFIGCKTVASGRVNPVEGRLGQAVEVINLVGQAITLVPVVGQYISTILQMSTTLVKKIDSKRQKNTMTAIANSGMLLHLWEVSQQVAQILTERYQPLLEQLYSLDGEPQLDKEDSIRKVTESKWWQYFNKGEQLSTEGKSAAQEPSVEIIESQYCLCYTKTRKKVLKEKEKTEAKEIGEYAVVLILAALQNGEIGGEHVYQLLEKELLEAVCIPRNEGDKNTESYFSQRRILTKDNKEWTLHGFYRKPGLRTEEGQKYSKKGITNTQLYGFRLGTKEEADRLELNRIEQ